MHLEILTIKTTGDKITDKPLYCIGGKNLFTKEIEEALLLGVADLAVHSAKDIPHDYNRELNFACILPREDPRDVFISNKYNNIESLPEGSIIGTSSVRRGAQILAIQPNITIATLRGNISTRIKKAQEFCGIILAYAGIKRLNLSHLVRQILEPDKIMPAICQGIIAVQCRNSDFILKEKLNSISESQTLTQFMAERSFVETIQGSCTTPLGCYTYINGQYLIAEFMIASRDGSRIFKHKIVDNAQEARKTGAAAAKILKQYM